MHVLVQRRPRVRSSIWEGTQRVRGTPRALKLIAVIACLQTLAWNLALPPLQGPDEAGHVAYVQHLAETGHAPVVNGAGKPNSTEEDTALVLLGLGPML